MSRSVLGRPWLLGAAGVLGAVALWEIVSVVFRVPAYVLPSPVVTAQALVADAALLARHTATTAAEAVLGLAVSFPLGVGIAIALSASRVTRGLLYPSLVLSQAVPLIAVAPLILIWFGLGPSAKVLIVAFVCFFPITVNAVEGFGAANPLHKELLEALGARRRDLFRHAYIPAALPGIFAGLRVAATYCVLGAVVGEWLGGSRGLGVYMTRALQSFRTDRLFAAILIVMLLSFALFQVTDGIGRLLTPWLERRQHA